MIPHALYLEEFPIFITSESPRKLRNWVSSQKMDESTLWCAGMVVFPKPKRSSLYLHGIIESMLREVHPIPKVDEHFSKKNFGGVVCLMDDILIYQTRLCSISFTDAILHPPYYGGQEFLRKCNEWSSVYLTLISYSF